MIWLLALQVPQKPAPLPIELDRDRVPSIVTKGNCLIKGGTVLTVSHGTIVGGDVLIQNGKITAVGKGLVAPDGTVVIDAAGKFVSPGLVDAHTHLAIDATNEGGDAITPECRIEDVLNPTARGLYYKLAAGNTASLALHGSANPIGGESKIIKHKWKPGGYRVEEMFFPGAPRVVKFALGENVKQSNGTGEQTRFPGTRMGVEATYRRAFEEAKTYMADQVAGKPVRKDVRLEALSDMLRGNIIIHCHCYRQDEMMMLLRVAKDYHLKLVAFQHALESYKIAPELAAAGVGASIFVDHWDFKIEGHDGNPYAASILQQAGVKVSVNTDSSSGVTPFRLEAAKTMRFGDVSADEALRMVTLYPAQQLQIDRRAGSLDVGKDADIAIWSGFPLSGFSRCEMTLVDGDVLFQRRDAFGLNATSVAHPSLAAPRDLPPLALPISNTSTFAIMHATVHPVVGKEIVDGTVVVRAGKIVSVGKGAVPKDATRIDAKGLHVYPGLIDAGSDLGRMEFASTRSTDDDNEIGAFQPDLKAMTAVNPESEKIPVARLGGITAFLTRPNSSNGIVTGQSALVSTAGYTVDEMAIEPSVSLHINLPEGVNEFARNFLGPDQAAAAEAGSTRQRDDIEERLERAKRYATARAEQPSTPIDVKMEALRPFLDGTRPTVFTANTAPAIRRVVALAERLGMRPIIQGGKESWKVADLLAKKKIPVLLPLPTWSSPSAGSACSPAKDYDPYDAAFTVPALLNRAGVAFAFQSFNSEETYNLPLRAAQACAYGLPYDKALEALTIGAARILGVSDRLGSLEAGKVADLIITDGDPLEVTTHVRQMFIRGRPVSLENRWSTMAAKYRARVAGK